MSHRCRICANFTSVGENDPRWAAAAAEWTFRRGFVPVGRLPWCVKCHKTCRWYDAFFPMDQCRDYRPDFPANRLPGGEAT